MNLVKYFKFYYDLTRGRLTVLFILNFVAAGAQMLSAGAMLSVTQIGIKPDNTFTKAVYMLINYFHIEGDKRILGVLLIFAVTAFFVSAIVMMWSVVFVARLQADILVKLQPDSIKRLISSKYEFFLTQNIGYLNNIIVSQIRVVSQSFKLYADIIVSIFFAVSYLAFAFLLNPLLSVVMMIFGIPTLWVARIANRRSREISVESVHEYSKLNAIIIQMISNLKYLKSTETYHAVIEKLIYSSKKIAHLIVKLAFWGGINSYAITPFAVAFIALLVYWQVAFMDIKIVTALTTLVFLYAAAQKFIVIPSSYQKFLSSAGAIIIYEELVKNMTQHQETASRLDLKNPDFNGSIEFKDVSFRYVSGKEEVLKNINITISPFTSVAFVGGSGAGKSTVVNLITGLLSPTKGSLIISGADYKEINLAELRKRIGYVTQESVIFNDTVRNNISLWDKYSDIEQVEKASHFSHAHEFVSKMPQKYETLLGDNGLNISGGQRQRISIAREFFRETPMLVLDEATSALDSETEQLIHESIEKYHGKKTLVIIAHRLSTIKKCDIIYVLDGGEIVEHGNYDELFKKHGRFRKMVETQALS